MKNERTCTKCFYGDCLATLQPCCDCKLCGGNNDRFQPKENTCMKCGVVIPEGRHVCLTCEGANEMQTFTETAAESKPTNNAVDHPAHYQGAHECIDEMLALFGVEAVKGFCKCNVYKYRYRADRKNGAEDIRKADWYMSKLMELEGANNGNG